MAEDDNVIPFSGARRRKSAPGQDAPSEPGTEHREPEAVNRDPLPGKLVWLHCPTCGTVEYTEVVMGGGRQHNRCGTRVEEAELEIDLRAEQTIAAINLERLGALTTLLESHRARFEEYQSRLALIAGRPPEPYPLTEETLRGLPVAEVDALGLLVPTALHDPMRHFRTEDEPDTASPREEGDPAGTPPGSAGPSSPKGPRR